MNVQRATEAPNINSFQMRSSFGAHETRPGRILLANSTPQNVRDELIKMGYTLTFEERTSGPINAIFLDQNTRQCGAARAITAKTTASPGKKYEHQQNPKNQTPPPIRGAALWGASGSRRCFPKPRMEGDGRARTYLIYLFD